MNGQPAVFRWTGFCLACWTPGAELQTRWDIGPKCDACYARLRPEPPAQLTLDQGARP